MNSEKQDGNTKRLSDIERLLLEDPSIEKQHELDVPETTLLEQAKKAYERTQVARLLANKAQTSF